MVTVMRFREMEPKDAGEVLRVRSATRQNALTTEELVARGITPESTARILDEGAKGWVCEESGEILGFSMGDETSGEVLVLAVLAEHEGRGIGRGLLALVQGWLFSKGHRELWLLENPDPSIRAYGFYRSLGWAPTGEYRADGQVLTLCRPPRTDLQR